MPAMSGGTSTGSLLNHLPHTFPLTLRSPSGALWFAISRKSQTVVELELSVTCAVPRPLPANDIQWHLLLLCTPVQEHWFTTGHKSQGWWDFNPLFPVPLADHCLPTMV